MQSRRPRFAEGYLGSWHLDIKKLKIINGNIGNESIDPLKFPNTNICSAHTAHTRLSIADANVSSMISTIESHS